ncbi:GGDEF domain-containing protein [Chromatocurvus halotolerans]|uniref:diguanylate cyclase n=1 Tax=Chromatocurvus halotolerans TaxID=1132028 RepID=A0A4R2KXN1_9GAMM|nr:GGDEF domain-containing protein [Chromatocurvus halotolerans]TCO76099.1 diguanylate cyclase (GGDEF)-like protein [Chromatocurvus halotolerans]
MIDSVIRDEEGDVLRVLRSAFRKALAQHRASRLELFLRLQFPEQGDGRASVGDLLHGLDMLPVVAPEVTSVVSRHHLYAAMVTRHGDVLQQAGVALEAAARGRLDQAAFLDLTAALQRLDVALDRLDNAITVSLTHVDELTGLLNRSAMERDLEREHAQSRRTGRSLSVAMVDADHFKRVNDDHGHAFGDTVLEVLAERFEACLRPRDRAYRYGGEEFLVMLPDTGLVEAGKVAERLRRSACAEPVVEGSSRITLTVSIGLAEIRAGESIDDGLRRADKALYEAKNAGRNRVVALDHGDA